jgi:AraC-like DNA-binding protein
VNGERRTANCLKIELIDIIGRENRRRS